MRHFLDLSALSAGELRAILDDAHARKAARKTGSMRASVQFFAKADAISASISSTDSAAACAVVSASSAAWASAMAREAD